RRPPSSPTGSARAGAPRTVDKRRGRGEYRLDGAVLAVAQPLRQRRLARTRCAQCARGGPMQSKMTGVLPLLCTLVLLPLAAAGQGGVDFDDLRRARADGEWLTHGGDYAETRFSTLDGINAENVANLEL